MKRVKHKTLLKKNLGRMAKKLTYLKACVRSKVEHSFQIIKNLFRHRKAPYHGQPQKTAQLFNCAPSPIYCRTASA